MIESDNSTEGRDDVSSCLVWTISLTLTLTLNLTVAVTLTPT